ncbi:MAG TPA: fused MFS/spermidine synthase [Stellaceae bacterium]|jgi:MFS family permease
MARSATERQPVAGRAVQAVLLVNAFFVGSVLMGFEMLGSRYLFPYFGGGIGTWAGLISTVLAALTIGYLVGGAIVDRHPSPRVITTSCAVAAIYLALVPLAADPLMMAIMNNLGYGPVEILIASGCLLLVPLSFLGTFSPVAVRLMLRSTEETGRIAGLVYGISTIGNIFGTLFTTFYLIPTIGSREITYVYAAVLALCALSLQLVPKASR